MNTITGKKKKKMLIVVDSGDKIYLEANPIRKYRYF